MSQPRDREGRKIEYDTLCTCSHIAAEHWVSDRKGNLFLSNCRECKVDFKYLEGWFRCENFQRDNLAYLENELKKKEKQN
jgi:hypothetical protein